MNEDLIEARAALRELRKAKERRTGATLAYYRAMKRCVDLKVPNTRMALELGVSETAIRLYRKRKGI
jgi:hypothetical protein